MEYEKTWKDIKKIISYLIFLSFLIHRNHMKIKFIFSLKLKLKKKVDCSYHKYLLFSFYNIYYNEILWWEFLKNTTIILL